FFFFQAEDGIRDGHVTGVQTCALPISRCADLLSREARPARGPDSGLHALLAGARLEPRPRLDVGPVRGPARSRLGAPPPAAVAGFRRRRFLRDPAAGARPRAVRLPVVLERGGPLRV